MKDIEFSLEIMIPLPVCVGLQRQLTREKVIKGIII